MIEPYSVKGDFNGSAEKYQPRLGRLTLVETFLLFVNPFPNKPLSLRVCTTSLLKTLWEKEKLLLTSNFSFSHSVFYPLGKRFAI